VDISEQFAIARRYRVLLIALPLALGALGFGLATTSTKQYAASATVLLRLNDPAENLQSASGQSNTFESLSVGDYVETQIGVITGRRVLDASVADLANTDYDTVEEMVTATRLGNTTLVKVVATGPDPAQARDVANAVVTAYAEDRRESAVGGIERALDEVKAKLQTLRSDLESLSETADDSSASATELKAVELQFAELFRQQQELEINLNLKRGGIEVISDAQLPEDPVAPKPLRTGITAMILGGLLALAIAFLRDRLDTSIRSSDDVAALTKAPILASIPEDGNLPELAGLGLIEAPFSPFAEAIRGLRTSMQFLSLSEPVQVLVVTGTLPGEGKTTIAVNLAAAHAQAGKRVLLVSADLRKPRADKFFNITRDSQGLSDLVMAAHVSQLRGLNNDRSIEGDLNRAVQATDCDGLYVLPAGTVPPNPNELLGSDAMAVVIAQARTQFDVVIVDSPPVALVSDAIVTARVCDGVLLVASAGIVERGRLKYSLQQIELAGLNLVGITVNRAGSGSDQYGAYGSYGGYEVGRNKRRWRRKPTQRITDGARNAPQAADDDAEQREAPRQTAPSKTHERQNDLAANGHRSNGEQTAEPTFTVDLENPRSGAGPSRNRQRTNGSSSGSRTSSNSKQSGRAPRVQPAGTSNPVGGEPDRIVD
jgi:polysaccharide biosynthesis transport protein